MICCYTYLPWTLSPSRVSLSTLWNRTVSTLFSYHGFLLLELLLFSVYRTAHPLSPTAICTTTTCLMMKCNRGLPSDAGGKRRPWSGQHLLQSQQHRQKLQDNRTTSLHIQSLCRDGLLHVAVDLMQKEGAGSLTQNDFWSLLKLCQKNKSLHHAKLVHAHMMMTQQCNDPPTHHPHTTSLYEYLVLTLVKCGGFENAFEVFEELLCRTVFSWTALICGYSERGNLENALQMYVHMLEEGVNPNEYTFVCLVKACANIGRIDCGQILHAHALMEQYDIHDRWAIFVSTLVRMYAEFGQFTESERLFWKCRHHCDVVSWTTMLSVFIENGLEHKAMEIYKKMYAEGVIPNEWTIAVALQGCSALVKKEGISCVSVSRTTLDMGHMLHVEALQRGFVLCSFIGNNLVRMYGNCGHILDAESVFVMLTNRNIVSWTEILSIYVEHCKTKEALKLYRQMHEQGVDSDEKTLLTIIKACCVFATKEESIIPGETWPSAKKMSLEIGQAFHSDAKRKGSMDSDIFIVNALLHLYAKCEAFEEAEDLFRSTRKHDIISWTIILSLNAEQGNSKKVLLLYKEMQREGITPDEHAITSALQACCKLLEMAEIRNPRPIEVMPLEIGKALHNDVLAKGLDCDIHLRCKITNMYGKCGGILEAEHTFYASAERDSILYNVMLSTYVEQGSGEMKALELFQEMQERGIFLEDDSAYVSILRACSDMGSVELCRQIHHSILWIRDGLNRLLGASLIHAYGNCMTAVDSESIFSTLAEPDTAVWNALIDAYTQCGEYAEALNTFDRMQSVNVPPNAVTFLSLLSACCQMGLLDKGVEFFESMSYDGKRLSPDIRHYGCLIDLLGRAGDFERLEKLLLRMPIQADMAVYLGSLGACRVYGNMHLGKHLFDHLRPRGCKNS